MALECKNLYYRLENIKNSPVTGLTFGYGLGSNPLPNVKSVTTQFLKDIFILISFPPTLLAFFFQLRNRGIIFIKFNNLKENILLLLGKVLV